ncbi:aminopeptidase P N-terminal domain-containing protein [Salinisphaera sp.]|uniref:aminopeptidase P N-terminal domain-containing protein n=1 Tax=Salinisphaera sp. TaxID=1914330 RepID=UPI002D78EF98|nr:aminopeptidase P N-terminal domain-containing protein [Salinisphaera sp.]
MIPGQSHLNHADDPSEHAARRAALAREIGEAGIAVVAATPERNRNNDVDYPYRPNSDFRYLTGFPEPSAIAVLAPGRERGEYVLFCRERDPAAETWTGYRAGTEGAMTHFGADQAFPIDEFDTRIGEMLTGRERLYMTQGIHAAFEQRLLARLNDLRARARHVAPPEHIVSINSVVHEMRLRKSESELALMRQAAATSAAGHCAAMRAAAPGVYEYQLAATLHYVYGLDGMQWAYPTIVGAGANACVLHYVENAAALAEGDLVLIDSGAEYRGYAGDITRTFPANGRFTAAQREIYDIVLAANEAAIAACRAGAKANAPHRTALDVLVDGLLELGLVAGDRESVLEDESYKTFFMHGTSHWLGMDVHDVGRYKTHGDWRDLEPGMVLTIEPGLYIPLGTEGVDERYWGIGVRIEDDVVITHDEPEVMTAAVPKAPEALEALMREGA